MMAIAHFGPRGRTRHMLGATMLAVGMVALVSPADAINCKGEYQIVQGQYLATPYCQDNYLAKVARGFGVRVSDREIRNNPNRKAEVCRFMGFDTRVSHICAQYRNDGGGRFR